VDKVFCYDYPQLENFLIEPYANAFSDFIRKVKPSSVLVAPHIGALAGAPGSRTFCTGLTADCTALEMKRIQISCRSVQLSAAILWLN
jgi:electron transfer flavoprotein alpha subunit